MQIRRPHRWQARYLIRPSTQRSLSSDRHAICRLKRWKQAKLGSVSTVIGELQAVPAAWTQTDRLEIGRYVRTSAWLMCSFFESGVMYAALKASGTEPLDRDHSVEQCGQQGSDDVYDGFKLCSRQRIECATRTTSVTSSITDWNWQNATSASGRCKRRWWSVACGASKTVDLVVEITMELCSTDVVKRRYVTTTQQHIHREPQSTRRRLFAIDFDPPELLTFPP